MPVERLQAALALGLTTFGENRVQEAEEKAPTLPSARWAMVGHLQSNKAARAVELFSEIQSVHSVALAERLAHVAAGSGRAPYPIYLQVNVDDDPAKDGFDPDDVVREIGRLAAQDGPAHRGLDDRRPPRERSRNRHARPSVVLRELSVRLRESEPGSVPVSRWA